MFNDFYFEYRVFLIILLLGLVAGFLLSLFKFILHICKGNIVAKNILDFLYVSLFTLLFFVVINYVNFGVFRLHLIAGYSLACYAYIKTLGKPVAKGLIFIYTKCRLLATKFKNSRMFKAITK